MTHKGRIALLGTVLCGTLGWSVPAYAQGGGIGGTVKDATGAVLPGVTVEAASPALIEKVRSVTTDERGEYKIVDLRPGTYSVKFTLPGFTTVVRSGVDLTTGFTATVDGDMKVGTVEETVTVSGAAPVVDVQSSTSQRVLSDELMRAIPTGGGTNQVYASLTLGAVMPPEQQDVGGHKGEAGGSGDFAVHGASRGDSRAMLDGMLYSMQYLTGGLLVRVTSVNTLAIQETVVSVSGNTAEHETGGTVINAVPKDGSNLFSGLSVAQWTSGAMQGTNLSDEAISRGIGEPAKIDYIYDVGAAVGGPIKRDKLWFYGSYRAWATKFFAAGNYFNKTLHTFTYTPDLSQQAYTLVPQKNAWTRLTWQATGKQKVGILESIQHNCECYEGVDGGDTAPEAAGNSTHWPISLTQVTWSYPRTNRLLFEAGNTSLYQQTFDYPSDATSADPRALPTDIPIIELSTGFQYGAAAGSLSSTGGRRTNPGHQHQSNQRFSVSYVTGSHAVKFGMTLGQAWNKSGGEMNDIPGLGPVAYRLLRGVPNGLTQYASPSRQRFRLMPNLGLYAQDRWTVANLTLNLGIRYDHNRQYAEEEDLPAIPAFGIPARHFPKVDNVPNWHDISPRFGAAYDVFGDGRTAIKGAYGRYVLAQGTGIGQQNTPTLRLASAVTRSWSDADGDFFPDCNLADPLRNGECGQISDLNFGQLRAASTTYDPAFLEGWFKRPSMWQGSLQLQQQLRANIAVNVGYYNVRYGNFPIGVNTAVTPADFSEFCVTTPTDPRLGSFSGQELCGLFDINPAKFGIVDNHVTLSSELGAERFEHYNGVEVSVNARLPNGATVQGGYSTGQTVSDNCAIAQRFSNVTSHYDLRLGRILPFAAAPTTNRFCHLVSPWSKNGQVKAAFTLPLPGGIALSGTYQNLSGFNNTVRRTYINAEIQPSLGRPLSGRTSATLAIVPAFQLYEDRIQQLDLRFAKAFRVGRARIEGNFDIYNAFNASPILNTNPSYGSTFLKPSLILAARLFKVGAQVTF